MHYTKGISSWVAKYDVSCRVTSKTQVSQFFEKRQTCQILFALIVYWNKIDSVLFGGFAS